MKVSRFHRPPFLGISIIENLKYVQKNLISNEVKQLLKACWFDFSLKIVVQIMQAVFSMSLIVLLHDKDVDSLSRMRILFPSRDREYSSYHASYVIWAPRQLFSGSSSKLVGILSIQTSYNTHSSSSNETILWHCFFSIPPENEKTLCHVYRGYRKRLTP